MAEPGGSKKQVNVEDVDGTWREAITIAVEATRIAFPGGEVLAHLDHKLVTDQSHNNFELAATLIFVLICPGINSVIDCKIYVNH